MTSTPQAPFATIVLLMGTRPEIIKLWPLARELQRRGAAFEVWFSGQHPDLGPQALETLDLAQVRFLEFGDFDSMPAFLGGALPRLADELRSSRPALLVVQGDTSTAYAGAQAAFLSRVPVAHVEAGLRSHDLRNPYPEEFFRSAIARCADVHFAPTRDAADNLVREGIAASSVHVTGNTVVDALEAIQASLDGTPAIPAPALESGFAVLTVHRRESFGPPLVRVATGLRRVLEEHPRLHLVFPGHPNPGTRPLREALAQHERVHLIEPLGYRDFLGALARCSLAFSDSGGVQEEAPSFQKPVVVLREVTERPEGIRAGFSYLTGTDPDRIAETAARILAGEDRPWLENPNPYGDGRAAPRIADVLLGLTEHPA